MAMDEDILSWTREELIAEVVRLRTGIRAHRDSSGHDLCWHHPKLWGLLPEPIPNNIAVPAWPQFLRGCVKYREALDRELPDAPRTDVESNNTSGKALCLVDRVHNTVNWTTN
jgi:hypothetical protein